ncbi:MAG: DUF418 domain-containing protein [Bacteroides sp.]|nr:DUF418 domain-containing protein [Bacteroides sp.]
MHYSYTPSALPNTRIQVADVLRGMAIGGIVLIHFIEHLNFYSFPEHLTALDRAVWDSVFFLLAGKMYAIFAMLFGLSFFIQHDNQAQRGKDFRLRFAWRMVLLMGWGLLDLFFFNGDILFLYAVCGLLVLPLIRLSNKTLAIIAGILLLQPVELVYIVLGLLNPELKPLDLGSGALFREMMPALANGSIWEAAYVSIVKGLPMNFLWAIENGRMTQTLFLFLLGILVGRSRLLYDEGDHARCWKRVLLGCVVAFAVLCPIYLFVPKMVQNACVSHSLEVMLNMWKNMAMMLFVVAGTTLLFRSLRWRERLLALAPYGKMSLTNYLGQSVVGAFLFYGWGLGLHQYCGHAISLLMGLLFVILQVFFCRWWLAHHKRGPLEELWYRATWWRKS